MLQSKNCGFGGIFCYTRSDVNVELRTSYRSLGSYIPSEKADFRAGLKARKIGEERQLGRNWPIVNSSHRKCLANKASYGSVICFSGCNRCCVSG